MSDLDTVIAGTLLSLICAGWFWYLGDDEMERQAHERWLRDTKRQQVRSNATGEQTGSRCNSVEQSGCGDVHAHCAAGPDQPR